MDKITVAAVSTRNWIGQPDRSLRNMKRWATRAAEKGAEFVAFPELGISGYFHSDKDAWSIAEPVPGPSTHKLIKIAGELNVILCAGLLEKHANVVYNTQIVVNGQGLLGKQRKTHMPGSECFFWRPGTELTPINVGKAVVGIAICFDANFPEVTRTLFFKGAEILVMPFAFMTGPRQTLPERDIWCMGWRYHCAQNAFFGIVVNNARTPGRTDKTEQMQVDFPGWAGIFGTDGRVIDFTRQRGCGESMSIATLDPAELHQWRYNKYFKPRCLNPHVYVVPFT